MAGRVFLKDRQILPSKYTCLNRILQGTYVHWATYSYEESLSKHSQSKIKNKRILEISV